MKIFNFIILSSIFLFYFQVRTQVRLINLGNDCEPAWNLSYCSLRKEAFPFDWLQTPEFEGIIKLIQDNFKYFLDPKYLVLDNHAVKNTYYNIKFVHDFPTHKNNTVNEHSEISDMGQILSNFLDFLPIIKKKYERRIERFYNALNSGEKIIFFRTHITPLQAKDFVKLMSDRFEKTNFKLIVVHSNKKYSNNWKIPHVYSFYAIENPTKKSLLQSWFDHNLWKEIFFKINIINS